MMMRTLLPLVLLWIATAAAAPPVEQDVPYQTISGTELHMDIAVPDGDGPFPAVVCLHGGGWSMGSKRSFLKTLPELAAGGYVAVSVQYRLAPGAKYPAQIEDVRSALRFLRLNAKKWKIDSAHIALLGASAGAHLALLAGFQKAAPEESVQAIVNVSAPTDLRDWRMNETAEGTLVKTTGKTSDSLVSELLGTSDRRAPIVAQASPITHVRSDGPPVLIFHWKEDQAVAAGQAQRLIEELRSKSARHEVVWFEGKGHALNGPGSERIIPRTIEFLRAVFAQK